jgi:hypothetical protein
MSQKKYLHLSDILSFYTGRIVSSFDALTKPDGSIKPKWETMMQPILEVAEAISGEALWINKSIKQYDGYRLSELVDDINLSLVEQMPWLKNYAEAPDFSHLSKEESGLEYQKWVLDIAALHGGEWQAVSTMSKLKPYNAPKPMLM